ncbi:MAG: hypothetical protein KDE48_20015 [Anaerolineales bacterium]|nr:hypothetical protein [Anaerolineales bacterium]
MKIAYLILAHKYPCHFKRLVKELESESTQVFAHIDKRVDIQLFKSVDTNQVIFLEDRLATNWGGYKLLLAMIRLLRTALETDKYDYFQFLSGQDYPIKSNQEIVDFLVESAGDSYMFSYPLSPEAPKAEVFFKYRFADQIAQLPPAFHKVGYKFEGLINYLLPERALEDYIPYRGSQWVCLHRDAADYCINFLDTPEGKRFLHFFRYSWGSDEVMLPSLLLNSPLANRVKCDPYRLSEAMYAKNLFALHYIDWDQDRSGPAVFDEDDFEAIRLSKAFFARKFSEEKSSSLLDRIDLELRQANVPAG